MMTASLHQLTADFAEVNVADATGWTVNAGHQPMAQDEAWKIQGQPAWGSLRPTEVRPFQSAEDLDFTGDFPYAVNAGGTAVTIGDASFVDGSLAGNAESIQSRYQIAEWYSDADYGDSTEDNALELVMESIRWDRSSGITVNLDVDPGQTYKLQLLFAELWAERGFDVYVEGEKVVTDLAIYVEQGGINRKDTGVVVTHELIAPDDEINIQLVGNGSFANNDTYLQAFTLESIDAPVWLQLGEGVDGSDFGGFAENDVLVRPAGTGSGYGSANVTWTSLDDTMITVAGGLWSKIEGEHDYHWRIDLNGEELTAGTLLANQFDRQQPFDVRAGSGGVDAIRNVPVQAGDELQLTVFGSNSEFLGVDLSVTADARQIPRYPLGDIPGQDATSGEPIQFLVDVPDEAQESLSMRVHGFAEDIDSRASLTSEGLLTFTPSAADRFNVTVTLEAVVDGIARSQQVTFVTNVVPNESELVSVPGDLPLATDYTVVAEETLAEDTFFNTQNRNTRRVEISGKEVRFVPNDPSGLFERFHYSGGLVNADIQELVIYAETVVVGGELRLPATDVVIYAKELLFQDDMGVAQINTTPLAFSSAAKGARIVGPDATSHITRRVPGENGKAGENAGDVTLHVQTVVVPESNPTAKRFLMKGGRGQQAGAGMPGTKGTNRKVLIQNDLLAAGFLDPSRLLIPREYPNTTYVKAYPLIGSPAVVGSPSFPSDGGNATPGGRPGTGGAGGTLRTSVLELVQLAELSGGASGARASNQPGGTGGTPRTAQHVSIPFIGGWTVTSRTSRDGNDWTAPSGSTGAAGQLAVMESGWVHPASMRAMLAHARDAYRQGHSDLAARAFASYGNLLDDAISASPKFVEEFRVMRSEVAEFEHQLANRLDYFGNPLGWAPTLSFGANYRAFQNAIESDLRTLYLTRFVQRSEANQQVKVQAVESLIDELDVTVQQAKLEIQGAREKLPKLQSDLQNILVDTRQIQDELDTREVLLASRAGSNVSARNALNTIGGLLSVVPVPTVSAIGVGLSSVHRFLAEPSLSGFATASQDLADPFKQEQLDESALAISDQLDQLKLPSTVDRETLTDYGSRLAKLGSQWAPVVSAFHEVTSATQLPADEVAAELDRLKAQDPEFRQLAVQLEGLLAKKQAFAAELATTMHVISRNLNLVATGYATAESLNQERSVASARTLSHRSLDRVMEMERDARDRLLRYQYHLAKAFEYETLTAYPGDFGLSGTFDEIVRLLDGEGADAKLLDDPERFAALQSVYESELREVADPIWGKLNSQGPQRTSEIKFTLNPSQVAELNRNGMLTLNLIEDGFINAARQDIKLIQVGVDHVDSVLVGEGNAQAANVQLRIEHEGQSTVQSAGRKYAFQHRSGQEDDVLFWSTDYDAIGGDLVQSEVSPSDMDALASLLNVEVGGLRSPYAHPGARADLTIRTAADVVPRAIDVEIQRLTLFVRYDSDLPQAETVLLDVRTPEGTSPRILLDQSDVAGYRDGDGPFTRFYAQGQAVTLTAEPTYGGLQFAGWLDEKGEVVGSSPILAVSLADDLLVQATYESRQERLLGDANDDGFVDFADFLILSNNFGRASDVAFADGDFDASGTVDFADFLVLSNQFGTRVVV